MLIIRLRVNKQEFLEILVISDALALAWSSAFRRLIRSFQPRKRGTPNLEKSSLRIDQTLLPLHLSFCRTTLKNEASGNDANGSVFFALRTVTIDPRSTRIGLRPSSVRYTG